MDRCLFYLRFFLHSIPEDVQETLMGAIRDHARPGDFLCAEFRTDETPTRRRCTASTTAVSRTATCSVSAWPTDFGFTVLHEEEGTGLSPYKGEDPVLYRVVAHR